MALLGTGALAMWWNMAAAVRPEFEDWHSHEHFPERMGIPGFRRGSRWTDAAGGEGIFVLYELESYETMSSAPYLARLNAPTPWSTKLMPHHHGMVRSPSRVLASRGGGVARHAVTVRLSPHSAREAAELGACLTSLIESFVSRPGLTGAHLLRHETPAIAQTTEQKIRGSADRVADWVLVVTGYDAQSLEALSRDELSAGALTAAGAAPAPITGLYVLSYSATPADVI